MKVIITMAGQGSRFKEVGITKPKHKIKVKGRSLFNFALSSLKNFFNSEFIFIDQKAHKNETFIDQQCSQMGIENYQTFSIDQMTNGQASTAILASSVIDETESSILIYNIDTYVEEGTLKRKQIKGKGWIPSFEAEGDRWSFVEVDDNQGSVSKVVEKEKISNLASIGLYYFSSFNLFADAYFNWDYNKEEKYIAPLYNYLIKNGESVKTQVIPNEKVHILGTPEDLGSFEPEFKKLFKG